MSSKNLPRLQIMRRFDKQPNREPRHRTVFCLAFLSPDVGASLAGAIGVAPHVSLIKALGFFSICNLTLILIVIDLSTCFLML